MATTASKLPKWWITFVVWLAIKLFESVGIDITGFEPDKGQ